MKKDYPLEKMDLALFENKKFNESGSAEDFSQLKDFLSFLKLYGYPKPIRFSHVGSSGPLIENLSLKENLLLHASGNEQECKNAQLERLLEQSGNPHLQNLYSSITLKDSMPSSVDDETRKALAIVKALIQISDFLFLENPEKFLGKKLLSLVVQALVYKSATTGLIVVISSRFKNIWAPHLTKKIFRDEKNFFQVDHFSVGHENSFLKLQNTEEAQEEGVLKIVNPQSSISIQNKKTA